MSITPKVSQNHNSESESKPLMDNESVLTLGSFMNLLYKADGSWIPIPAWARSLMDFGTDLAKIHESASRRVVAMVLPTRTYAAAFLAAGIITERARMLAQGLHLQERFEVLWNLPIGHGVYVFNHTKRFKGVIVGHQEVNGCRALRIQFDKNKNGGGTTFIISPNLAHHVQPAERQFSLPRHQSGYEIEPPRLLGQVLFQANMALKQWYSNLECLILGNVGVVEEASDIPIALNAYSNSLLEGTLGDLLLPKRVQGETAIYFSDLLSLNKDDDEQLPFLMEDTVVVLNGSEAFIETEHHWVEHDLVVLLSPQDRMFSDAVHKINGWYARSSGLFKSLKVSVLPKGVEIMAFEERR